VPSLTIAHVHPPDAAAPAGATQQVSVSATAATILVAVIGIVPALTTALVDWMVRSPLAAQVEEADVKVKTADADAKKASVSLEERRLEEAWLRSALSIADDSKRAEALKFLVSSGLVAHDFKAIGDYVHPPQLVTSASTPASQSTTK
jgi:hypothetical protein